MNPYREAYQVRKLTQRFQILVVDDFGPFRQWVCSALRKRAEFQLFEACDGLGAVRKAEQLQPDLIVLDIGLPDLNGVEVCRCAGSIAPTAKILFLSHESSADVVQEAFRTGAQGYVQKLSGHSELLPAIDAVLKGEYFLGSGLVGVPLPNGQQATEPEYLWQQQVLDAFESPRKSLHAKINIAERAIAGRLKDLNLKHIAELLALKRALRSLAVLIEETTPQPKATRKKDIA